MYRRGTGIVRAQRRCCWEPAREEAAVVHFAHRRSREADLLVLVAREKEELLACERRAAFRLSSFSWKGRALEGLSTRLEVRRVQVVTHVLPEDSTKQSLAERPCQKSGGTPPL